MSQLRLFQFPFFWITRSTADKVQLKGEHSKFPKQAHTIFSINLNLETSITHKANWWIRMLFSDIFSSCYALTSRYLADHNSNNLQMLSQLYLTHLHGGTNLNWSLLDSRPLLGYLGEQGWPWQLRIRLNLLSPAAPWSPSLRTKWLRGMRFHFADPFRHGVHIRKFKKCIVEKPCNHLDRHKYESEVLGVLGKLSDVDPPLLVEGLPR
jgi:hypothetical protein